MKILSIILINIMFLSIISDSVFSNESLDSVDEIIKNVEKRYSITGFTADFVQESTIKAMDIKDIAKGKGYFKHPGKMRWEYDEPEKQIIITDGNNLWIYKPADHQVMTGHAPSFFGGGKGASFLSDIRLLGKKFRIDLIEKKKGYYRLKLTPKGKTEELTAIFLTVSEKNFDVERIVTVNMYGDETIIIMTGLKFGKNLDDSLFNFKPPAGADIIKIDE